MNGVGPFCFLLSSHDCECELKSRKISSATQRPAKYNGMSRNVFVVLFHFFLFSACSFESSLLLPVPFLPFLWNSARMWNNPSKVSFFVLKRKKQPSFLLRVVLALPQIKSLPFQEILCETEKRPPNLQQGGEFYKCYVAKFQCVVS